MRQNKKKLGVMNIVLYCIRTIYHQTYWVPSKSPVEPDTYNESSEFQEFPLWTPFNRYLLGPF